MVRSSHFPRTLGSSVVTKATPPEPPSLTLSAFGADSNTVLNNIRKASMDVVIGNAERPSNIWYKMNSQQNFWIMYSLMTRYKREVSVMSTIINRSVTELFRHELEFVPKFAFKCEDCGYELQIYAQKCPQCGSFHLRKPDETLKRYFVRPNGKSFLEEANNNGQSLKEVLKAFGMWEYQNNQAYLLCVTGDIMDADSGHLERAYPLEFVAWDPMFVRNLYDDSGTPGTVYGFTRKDRKAIITFDTADDAVNDYTDNGEEIYPAYWQVGNNINGDGDFWLYTKEEVFQDHWMAPALTYGVPIWFDIEDDLLTYHYIEKHNLKKYKYGFVRKIIILPGFSEDDVENITKGITDVLAKNDNSIPIVCTPPPLPGVAEMRAQTLELGTESSTDLLQVKNDIRDRLCAHAGIPNLFAGDVEASGGMNSESQQITIFDRYLMDKYEAIDRMCDWILSWFPKVATDWQLRIMRPSKAYSEAKRRMDRIQEAQAMKSLGFEIHYMNGEFWYSEEPMDQQTTKMQMAQANQQMAAQSQQPIMDGGLRPGDGDGPPEKGTARREDSDIDQTEDEIELSKRENEDAYEA